MSPARPSLNLLRSLSDEHVLRVLMADGQQTRAELATRTGLSKPTVSDSVARLVGAGLVSDTGQRTTGRGRVGTYYALAADLGAALVVSIAPDGVVCEAVDVHGAVLAHGVQPIGRTARPAQVRRALRTGARRAAAGVDGPLRLAVVSAADPVDRITGRLVHLPDAPFLVGELSPVDVLAPLVDGPVVVDNDVHWAARAERNTSIAPLDNFAYLHLGEGLGCAVVSDGDVRRGARGIAGEIAHLITRGPHGRAVRFTDVFAALHLRRPGSTAIDTDRLLAAVGASRRSARTVLAAAVSDVLAALVALCDPELIVVGGSWGPALLDSVRAEFGRQPRHVALRAAALDGSAALTGARHHALQRLRAAILDTRSPS
ncbi:MAG TPA: ROK family transcriptional regulator [Jatrophihabitantaceae bacterium]|jgi:predicted NBD/HSP70 family sugar kinase